MNIDIAKAIRELLYEHNTVMIPGLGGFTATPAPAMVDYVQGTVAPPAKKLEFNPNLTLNDGILVNHVQKTATITAQEALAAVERYVETVHLALERREIIEIAQVGRLYMDYEQKIKFMPEATNFNLDAFGLPTVSFSPVVRERPSATQEPKPAPAAPTPAVPVDVNGEISAVETLSPSAGAVETEPAVSNLQRLLPWLVVLSAVVIALTVFLLFSEKKTGVAADDLPADPDRVNVKPNPEERQLSDEDSIAPPPPARQDVPANKPTPSTQQETPPTATETPDDTGENQVFIVVHSFGVQKNARAFARQLKAAGYEPETKKDGLYKVGVILSYDRQSEVDNLVKKLGEKFQSQPKILEVN